MLMPVFTQPLACDGETGAAEPIFTLKVQLFFGMGFILLLAQVLAPFSEFIHHGDDAFYYFKLAANYPRYGFWTFDGIHPTNGVQPLWAILLTAVAQLLAWISITDVDVLARLFVGLAACFHFAGCVLLFRLLARQVSPGTALAAAGGMLFSMGLVWVHLWGLENSLYAFLLLLTVMYYRGAFCGRGTAGRAVVLGLLLGLTALARLNAGFLIPCLLGFYLFENLHGSLRRRLMRALAIGATASAMLLPYFAWNLAGTGHILPVSGAVKSVRAERFFEQRQISDRWSTEGATAVARAAEASMEWFVSSRALDGMWIAGARSLFDGYVDWRTLAGVIAFFLFAPLLGGSPGKWGRFLVGRLRKLAPYSFVLVFCIVNVSVSSFLYPFELTYSIPRWWMTASEIALITLTATLVAAGGAFISSRWLPLRLRPGQITIWIVALVLFSSVKTARYYWDGAFESRDWNISSNDDRYAAAIWMSEHLPADAIVGSWNAGVIGYYSGLHVVNLDGLINSWDFVPYLVEGRVAEYILKEKIEYLSDAEWEIETQGGKGLRTKLKLTPVYRRSMNRYFKQNFWVYRVDGPLETEHRALAL